MATLKIKIGDKIPDDVYFGVLGEGEDDPRKITARDAFLDKKVVLFGIPGAFTSVCSSQHLPQYVENAEKLKSKGVDVIACIAVNDPYVMREWAHAHKVGNKILMLSDGDKAFYSALGLLQEIQFAGERGYRFSMFVDNGVVKVLNIEEPGSSSYKISGPEHMLEDLEKLCKK
ncbi:16814_t:CDS:2 [Acaulospora colombiana]|uniref:16814_t:CDS:1 n=1 Tax=Acaulospora colombiana TaxID=27376 RepID=A0ACA9M9I5_9GLOM|nr:16814_t:CDS:2 [Acaulospora colombiana]